RSVAHFYFLMFSHRRLAGQHLVASARCHRSVNVKMQGNAPLAPVYSQLYDTVGPRGIIPA
ncbi:MAG: hypothetical protein ACREBC_24990, partial [Pyrinomonadaceae bacterium]